MPNLGIVMGIKNTRNLEDIQQLNKYTIELINNRI